jgi:hypothetical protein
VEAALPCPSTITTFHDLDLGHDDHNFELRRPNDDNATVIATQGGRLILRIAGLVSMCSAGNRRVRFCASSPANSPG